MLPLQYPSTTGRSSLPLLVITKSVTYLRCRPAELYLTAFGRNGALSIGCWWDGNTFAEEVVKEWVGEVASAAKYYLGKDSNHAKQSRTKL